MHACGTCDVDMGLLTPVLLVQVHSVCYAHCVSNGMSVLCRGREPTADERSKLQFLEVCVCVGV